MCIAQQWTSYPACCAERFLCRMNLLNYVGGSKRQGPYTSGVINIQDPSRFEGPSRTGRMARFWSVRAHFNDLRKLSMGRYEKLEIWHARYPVEAASYLWTFFLFLLFDCSTSAYPSNNPLQKIEPEWQKDKARIKFLVFFSFSSCGCFGRSTQVARFERRIKYVFYFMSRSAGLYQIANRCREPRNGWNNILTFISCHLFVREFGVCWLYVSTSTFEGGRFLQRSVALSSTQLKW